MKNNISLNTTHATTTRQSFFAKFTNWLNTLWRNVNSAHRIRRANRGPSVRKRLEDSLINMFICFCILVGCCISTYMLTDKADKALCFSTAALMLGIMAWLYNYRIAIAKGKSERIAFIAQTKKVYTRCFRAVVRTIRSIIWLATSVVVISFALQYVPNLSKHSPELMQVSEIVITFFNDILSKVFAYFA